MNDRTTIDVATYLASGQFKKDIEERNRMIEEGKAPEWTNCGSHTGEEYWFVTEGWNVERAICYDTFEDNFRLDKRNIYQYKEQAEFALGMFCFCKDRSFIPNWKDRNQKKYTLVLDYDLKRAWIGLESYGNGFAPFHYLSKELVREIIDKYSFEELEKYYGRV